MVGKENGYIFEKGILLTYKKKKRWI